MLLFLPSWGQLPVAGLTLHSQVYMGCDSTAVSPLRPRNELINFSHPCGLPPRPLPPPTAAAHSMLPLLEGTPCLLPVWEWLLIHIFSSIWVNVAGVRLLLLTNPRLLMCTKCSCNMTGSPYISIKNTET